MALPVSRDVKGGHVDQDGVVHTPLAGKTPAEVHKAHNAPDTNPKDQCQCAHCEEHRTVPKAQKKVEEKAE